MTLGGLLARVCRLAADFTPGWRVKVLPKASQVGIVFVDKSAAIVNQTSARVVKTGEEALLFRTRYALEIEQPLVEPDAVTENDPRSDPGPDF